MENIGLKIKLNSLICDIAEDNFGIKFYSDSNISDNTELLAILLIKIDEIIPNNYIYMEDILKCSTINQVVDLMMENIDE